MNKLITCAIAASFLTAAICFAKTPDKEAIMKKETAAWQAFKDKNADDFKKLVDKDFRGVYADGIVNMEKELDDMQKWDMKSFTFSDFKVTAIGSDIAMTTYKVTVQGTYDGKDASGTYNAGSVWKMEKGGWMGIFHTNIKEAAAAAK